MAFDGLVVRCIANELTHLLQGGRVDKIYMPDSETVVMGVRSLGKNYKLFLSCNPSLPRIHLTNESRDNPAVPPNFCMLLRKHLTSGRIVYIEQPGFERIIEVGIENRTEMGDLVVKRLIIEVMGRHSNIILVHQDGKIADCVRHVDTSISSLRLVLPGLTYESPPSQEKTSPLSASSETIKNILFSCPVEKRLDKYILDNFLGISPVVAREIVYRGCGMVDAVFMSLSQSELICIAEFIENLFDDIAKFRFSPVVIQDDQGKLIDYSAIPLMQYNSMKPIPCLSEYLDNFFIHKENYVRIHSKSSDMQKTVNNMLERFRRKAALQQQAIDESKKMGEFKLYGDLITANIYNIKKGDKRVLAVNYYDESMQEVEIPLEVELSPSQNAQKYYAKYNKLKNTAIAAELQLKNSILDIEYLESVQTALENCDTLKELNEIKSELAAEGYIKLKPQKGKQKKELQTTHPSKFVSSDGFVILVGKNNKQNDYLTLKLAKGNDIWFHTKNIPGSHTVVITQQKDVPDTTLVQAAMLAAYHSKARNSQNVAVDYTKIQNVKKPSGAKPGMVIYVDYKTTYVTPDENKVKELIK